MADVDPSHEHVLECLPLDLGDLVLRQVDGVDEAEVGEHLEVDLRQLVPRQVDRSNPGMKKMNESANVGGMTVTLIWVCYGSFLL